MGEISLSLFPLRDRGSEWSGDVRRAASGGIRHKVLSRWFNCHLLSAPVTAVRYLGPYLGYREPLARRGMKLEFLGDP